MLLHRGFVTGSASKDATPGMLFKASGHDAECSPIDLWGIGMGRDVGMSASSVGKYRVMWTAPHPAGNSLISYWHEYGPENDTESH